MRRAAAADGPGYGRPAPTSSAAAAGLHRPRIANATANPAILKGAGLCRMPIDSLFDGPLSGHTLSSLPYDGLDAVSGYRVQVE